LKINQQFARIAGPLHKAARRGRPYALPLTNDAALSTAKTVLASVQERFPEETAPLCLCKPQVKITAPRARDNEPLKAHIGFMHKRPAQEFARAMRARGHDLPLMEINPDAKNPQDSLRFYSVSTRVQQGMACI